MGCVHGEVEETFGGEEDLDRLLATLIRLLATLIHSFEQRYLSTSCI